MDTEQKRLLIKQAHRQPHAFRELYQIFFPRVYAYVAYRVGRKQDAEDLVSETFLKVVKHIDDFEYQGEGSFSAWLFRIARNEVNSFFRRNHRNPDFVPVDELPDLTSSNILPNDVVLRKEQFAKLRRLIGTLPPRRQEMILFKFFGGMRNQEIAKILSLDERTVASHLSRALDDLQQKIIDESVSEEKELK